MQVLLKGHNYGYEMAELLKLFLKPEDIEFLDEEALAINQSFLLVSNLISEDDKLYASAAVYQDGKIKFENKRSIKVMKSNHELIKMIKKEIKLTVFEVMSQLKREYPPWGILTGIRPTKIVHDLLDQGYNITNIRKELKENYKINDEKISLVTEIAHIERPFIHTEKNEYISVYISIPFCPTRCLYCSFPSNTLCKSKTIVSEYIQALIIEIEAIGKMLKELKKKIETIYIGGGTPTTLDASQFEVLFKAIYQNFQMNTVKEFTVEAGRPDTIQRDKLMVLKEYGVNRISINPQSMNKKTLELIGRSHTPDEIFKAYEISKKIGFPTINMDIIIGLPEETPDMLEYTMQQIEKMSPENLTVHTLAIKRASKLKENIDEYALAKEQQAVEMLQMSKQYASKMGMIPYYMYRQKYMLGNLENVGYCLPNHECIYNIQIMEERQSIIALGAGGISKIYYPKENRLERVPNVTNAEQYIERVREMIERKRKELEI